MNESDSEHIAGMLMSSGLAVAPSLEESDLIIVNTCAVREKSEEKLYSLLGRLESLKKKKGTIIGVVGYPTNQSRQPSKRLHHHNGRMQQFLFLLCCAFYKREREVQADSKYLGRS